MYRMRVLLFACLATTSAVAEDSSYAIDRYERGNIAVGVAASTMGIGPEVVARLHPNVSMRVTTGFGDFSSIASHFSLKTDGYSVQTGTFSTSYSQTSYTFSDLTAKGALAIADWHPFRDGARLSFGAGYLDVTGAASFPSTATYPALIGNGVYTAAQLRGYKMTFTTTDNIMPYTGFGYDNSFFKDYGLSLSSEIGVLWNYSNTVAVTGGSVTASDRALEQAAIKNKFDRLPVYPIVSFSAKYRF